jgi:hypothetical protein
MHTDKVLFKQKAMNDEIFSDDDQIINSSSQPIAAKQAPLPPQFPPYKFCEPYRLPTHKL